MPTTPVPAVVSVSTAFLVAVVLVPFACGVAVLAGRWLAYRAVGLPGWTGVVPVYQFYRRVDLVGCPTWYVAALFVPPVTLYVLYRTNRAFVARFDRGAGFAAGLTLLGVVFWPLLGISARTTSD